MLKKYQLVFMKNTSVVFTCSIALFIKKSSKRMILIQL